VVLFFATTTFLPGVLEVRDLFVFATPGWLIVDFVVVLLILLFSQIIQKQRSGKFLVQIMFLFLVLRLKNYRFR